MLELLVGCGRFQVLVPANKKKGTGSFIACHSAVRAHFLPISSISLERDVCALTYDASLNRFWPLSTCTRACACVCVGARACVRVSVCFQSQALAFMIDKCNQKRYYLYSESSTLVCYHFH